MQAGRSPVSPPWRPLVTNDKPPTDLRIDQPHPARLYDYLLGGKDNYPADREAAEQAIADGIDLRAAARQNRAFLRRASHYLAADAGIRQFLDIGTGIPTSPNLHEIVQAVGPESRVVYVDNDPLVLTHARALLTSTPQGRTAYLDADLRDPASILAAPELHHTLDLTRPVALSLFAILHFIPDDAGAYDIVRILVAALPAGSYLAISHGTADFDPGMHESVARYRAQGIPTQARSHDEIARFFDGLDLVDPGIEVLHRWRPDGPTPPGITDATTSVYGAVARKP
jgi:S-adenosyl methyltransferase